jgi:septal ring factor EnvC (AmiA/AmiB activator)
MEDIPLIFDFKIAILPKMRDSDTNIISNIYSEDRHRQFASVNMRTFNPLAFSVGTVENADRSNEEKIYQLQSKLSETESKFSQLLQNQSEIIQAVVSKLSETECKLSVTESQLKQTNALLNDCLNRLAQLEN